MGDAATAATAAADAAGAAAEAAEAAAEAAEETAETETVEAVAEAVEEPPAVVVVTGEEPEPSATEELNEALELDDRIRGIAREAAVDVVMDFAALMSPPEPEPEPVIVVEAPPAEPEEDTEPENDHWWFRSRTGD